MPLSWNEIRDRAIAFSKEWEDEQSERAEAQTFWNGFFEVFGIQRRRVAVFEKQVDLSRAKRKLKSGRIDAFWKGVLLIEHKSAGANLDRAFGQAADYFDGIAERDLPNNILVSDFKHFRLYDLEADKHLGVRTRQKLPWNQSPASPLRRRISTSLAVVAKNMFNEGVTLHC